MVVTTSESWTPGESTDFSSLEECQNKWKQSLAIVLSGLVCMKPIVGSYFLHKYPLFMFSFLVLLFAYTTSVNQICSGYFSSYQVH